MAVATSVKDQAIYKEMEADVRDWSHETLQLILSHISELGIVDKGNLFRKLKYRLGYDFGVVEKVAYQFPRYGVFVAKGVGRGRPVGSASAKQQARDWFNAPVDDRINKLSDLVAGHFADLTINNIRIK